MERPLAIACRREVASMRVKSTRLNDVIETAILFLYLPIQPNPSFPSVVQHPFTNAPISALNVDGSMRMLDLMKPDDLQLWQKEMEQVIRKITDPMLLLSRISKGYRLAFIKYVNDYLSIEDLSRLLRFAWRSVDILTYWDIQGESEVIVDPRKLQNVREELIETEKPQL